MEPAVVDPGMDVEVGCPAAALTAAEVVCAWEEVVTLAHQLRRTSMEACDAARRAGVDHFGIGRALALVEDAAVILSAAACPSGADRPVVPCPS